MSRTDVLIYLDYDKVILTRTINSIDGAEPRTRTRNARNNIICNRWFIFLIQSVCKYFIFVCQPLLIYRYTYTIWSVNSTSNRIFKHHIISKLTQRKRKPYITSIRVSVVCKITILQDNSKQIRNFNSERNCYVRGTPFYEGTFFILKSFVCEWNTTIGPSNENQKHLIIWNRSISKKIKTYGEIQ